MTQYRVRVLLTEIVDVYVEVDKEVKADDKVRSMDIAELEARGETVCYGRTVFETTKLR